MVNKFKLWLLQREGSGFTIDTGDPEDSRNRVPKVSVDDGSPVGGDPIFKKKNGYRHCENKSKKK